MACALASLAQKECWCQPLPVPVYPIPSRAVSASVNYFREAKAVAGAGGSIVASGTVLLAGRSWVWVPVRSLTFFNLPNPYSSTLALGFTQSLTEMSTRICF
jgi:hypothetical protein